MGIKRKKMANRKEDNGIAYSLYYEPLASEVKFSKLRR